MNSVELEGQPLPQDLPQLQPLPAEKAVSEKPAVTQEETLIKSDEPGGRKKRNLSSIAYMPSKPNIESLLLNGDRLVVISSGYGNQLTADLDYIPTIYEALATNIRIYDISKLDTTGEVTLVKETNVNGRFSSARAIGANVHVATFSGLNTYPYLISPLSRYQPDLQDLTEEQYVVAAKKLAEEELIPAFVEALVRDLSTNGDLLSNLARVSMWESELPTVSGDLESSIFSNGIINSLAQVTSFDMSQPSAELSAESSKDLSVSLSGAFMPTGWGETYATKDMLMLAGQGWNWDATLGGSTQTTYLLGFKLTGPVASPAAVGMLPGYLVNKFALDIVDGYLRVATTIRNFWQIIATPQMAEGEDAVAQQEVMPRTENYITVLKIPEITGTGPVLMEKTGSTKDFGKDGEVIMSVRFSKKVAYVVTFERTDPVLRHWV